jgi:hypothetical protein
MEEENRRPWPGNGPKGHRRRGMRRRRKNKGKTKKRNNKRTKKEGRMILF